MIQKIFVKQSILRIAAKIFWAVEIFLKKYISLSEQIHHLKLFWRKHGEKDLRIQ